MARSCDEVSVNKKYVHLLEGFEKYQNEEAIACRKCGDIFFGYTSLTRHCQSDHREDETLDLELRLGNSSSSHVTNENSESVLQYDSPRSTNLLSAANRLVPMLSQNSMQMRRHISARAQPYPSLSNYRSALNRGAFFLNRTQSTNLDSGSGSQPTGLASSPDNLITPAMSTLRYMQLNAYSSGRPVGSASPPIQQPSLLLHPGTSNLAQGRVIRSFMRPVNRTAARYPSSGNVEPFIQQQEQPTQETMVIEGQNDDGDNNFNTDDGLDLTLRL